VLAAVTAREFNALSPEGEVTWQGIHTEPDRWNFEPADEVIGFAARHGCRSRRRICSGTSFSTTRQTGCLPSRTPRRCAPRSRITSLRS